MIDQHYHQKTMLKLCTIQLIRKLDSWKCSRKSKSFIYFIRLTHFMYKLDDIDEI